MVIRRRKQASGHTTCIGYVRCSTSKQDLSPAAQAAALDRWVASEGAELLAVFVDKGVSGGAELADRPGLSAAIAHLHAMGRNVALLVAKRDRLARDVAIAADIERLVAKAGGRVLSADGSNGDDDGEALKRDLDAVLSAHERRVIRRRTRDALAVKRARGELTGCARYGMRVGADGVHLEPNPDEQRVIARAKELSDAGLTVRAIATALNAEGFRNRVGKPFAFQSVHGFLRPLLESAA
jgi:DNA invertase Pin-like site-specific DNA recombinase